MATPKRILDPEVVRVMPVANWVQPWVFYHATGYTEKAQERKREEGVWVEGIHWKKAPDGRVLMSLSGYNEWVERRQ